VTDARSAKLISGVIIIPEKRSRQLTSIKAVLHLLLEEFTETACAQPEAELLYIDKGAAKNPF
jgi:hypothetical protein